MGGPRLQASLDELERTDPTVGAAAAKLDAVVRAIVEKPAECAVCIASRRTTVDAYLLGFLAGFRSAVIATIDGRGGTHDLGYPRFCLAHEVMVTKVQAAEVRHCMGLVPDASDAQGGEPR